MVNAKRRPLATGLARRDSLRRTSLRLVAGGRAAARPTDVLRRRQRVFVVVTGTTTGWVDPARLAMTRQNLLHALAEIDAHRDRLSGSSVGVASTLRSTISDDLIPTLTRILDFDGWHRWESSSGLHQTSIPTTTIRFGTNRTELVTLVRHIAQGAIGNNVIQAFARHLAHSETDLGITEGEVDHPGSDWTRLLNRASSEASLPTAHLLAAVVTNDRTHRLARSLGDSARSDQTIARLLELVTPQLGDEALQSVLITLTSPEGTNRTPGVDPVAEQIAFNAILSGVSTRPEVARVLTDDPTRLAQIVTNPFLSPQAVEAAGRAGMLITGASPLLRHLVAIHHEHGELTAGGTRLATTALINDLDMIAPTIDLPVVRSQGPYGAIDIGTREQLAPLLADILEDEPSRVAMGVALHHLREMRIDVALNNLGADTRHDPTSTIAGQLADINDLSATFDAAAQSTHESEQLRRAELFSTIDLGLSVVGAMATVAAPVIGGAAALTISGSRELAQLIEVVNSENTTPEQSNELVNMTTTISVLNHITHDEQVRIDLHLDGVNPNILSELSDLINEFNTASTSIDKTRAYADVIQLSSQSIDLTTFLTRLRALSQM